MSGRIGFLLALGLTRLLAEMMSLPSLSRLADASVASPGAYSRRLPTSSIHVQLEWEAEGAHQVRPLSAESLEGLHPIERREAYRTLLLQVDGDGDRGPDRLTARALQQGLCGPARLPHDMGLDVPAGVHHFRLRSESGATSDVVCP